MSERTKMCEKQSSCSVIFWSLILRFWLTQIVAQNNRQTISITPAAIPTHPIINQDMYFY